MKVAAVLRNLREFGQNAAHNNRYMYLLYLQKQAKLFLKAQSFLQLELISNVFLPDQLVLALWSIFRLSLCTSTSDLLLHSICPSKSPAGSDCNLVPFHIIHKIKVIRVIFHQGLR